MFTSLEVEVERIPVVPEEECVIAHGRHCQANLLEIEEILERRATPHRNAVIDGLSAQERSDHVVDVASLTAVGTKCKSAKAPLPAELVEDADV